MNFKKGNGFAAILIVIGALMLFGVFAPLMGKLFGLIFPIILIALGYYGVTRGKVLIGWIVLVIGVLSLLSKLAWLIGPILGIALLVYGISLLTKKRNTY